MQFTPLKDFLSPELKSAYCKGLSYTARPADDPAVQGPGKRLKKTRENRALLAKLLPQWVAEGKVRYGSPDVPSVGRVSGEGSVK
jgi:hypothetical protein